MHYQGGGLVSSTLGFGVILTAFDLVFFTRRYLKSRREKAG